MTERIVPNTLARVTADTVVKRPLLFQSGSVAIRSDYKRRGEWRRGEISRAETVFFYEIEIYSYRMKIE